jgi:hypothetical protein
VKTSLCVYEIHIKHAKEELVEQIKELRVMNRVAEQILNALSTDKQVPEILQRLRNGETYNSIVEFLGRALLEEHDTGSPRESQDSTFEVSDHEMGGISSTFRRILVTSDLVVFDHLFQLYFA